VNVQELQDNLEQAKARHAAAIASARAEQAEAEAVLYAATHKEALAELAKLKPQLTSAAQEKALVTSFAARFEKILDAAESLSNDLKRAHVELEEKGTRARSLLRSLGHDPSNEHNLFSEVTVMGLDRAVAGIKTPQHARMAASNARQDSLAIAFWSFG